MTSIVSGGGSTADFQTYDDVQLQQATKTLDIPTDSLESAAGVNSLNNSYIEAYLNPPGKVELPQPTGAQATTMEQVVQGLQEFRQNLANKNTAQQEAVVSYMNDQKIYYEATERMINNLTPEQLQEIAYQPGMTDEAIREQVLFAVLHPDVDVPDDVREIASQIQTASLNEAKATLGAGWNPDSFAWVQDTGIMLAAQSYFDDAVGDMQDLSKDDVAELRFAMENPDAVESLSPRLKDIFEQVMGKVLTQTQMNFGIPDGWEFPQNKSSPVGLSAAYDAAFEKAIQQLVSDGKISEMEARQMETLHYHPEADVENAGEIKEKLGQIEEQVLDNLQRSWGFPKGYRPPVGANNRDAMLNMVYQRNFDQALKNYTPPLTAEQKDLIRAAQGLPEGTLPPDLQKISDSIKAGATSAVIEAYGLPDDWAPQPIAVLGKSSMAPTERLLKSLMNLANEITSVGEKHVASLPEGDLKNTYMVFLSMVASALAEYAEILTQSQVVQADMGNVLTQTRLDMELNKIEAQRNALEEQRKAAEGQQKGGFGGFLMNLITWVINIVLVVITLGAALGLIIDAACRGKDMASLNVINYAFEVANRVLGKPLGSWMLIIGYIVAYTIAMCMGPVGWVVGILMLAVVVVDIYVGNGDTITQVLLACGIPEPAASILSMIICMAISIIIDVIITIVLAFIPVGGEAGMVALWSAKIAMYTAKICAAVVRAVMVVIRVLGVVGKAIMIVAKLVMKALQMIMKLVQMVIRAILKAIKWLGTKMDELAKLFAKGLGKIGAKVSAEAAESAVIQGVKKGIKEAAEKAARKIISETMEESIKTSAEKFAKTSVGKLCKKVGKAAGKELKNQWDDLFDFHLIDDMKNCERNFDDYCKGVKNSSKKFKELASGDSSHWEQKVTKLERVQKAADDLKAAQKAMDRADEATSTVQDAKKAKEALAKAKEEFTASAVDYKRFDEGLDSNGWNNLQEWKKTKDLENKNLERANMTDGLSERKSAVDQEYNRRLEEYLGVEKKGSRKVDVDGVPSKQRMSAEDYIRETMPETYYQLQMEGKEGILKRAKNAKSVGRKGHADLDEASISRLESIDDAQSAFNDMKQAEKARDDARLGKSTTRADAGDVESVGTSSARAEAGEVDGVAARDSGGDGTRVDADVPDEGLSTSTISRTSSVDRSLADRADDAVTKELDKAYEEAREKFQKALNKVKDQLGKADFDELTKIEERKLDRIQDTADKLANEGVDAARSKSDLQFKQSQDNKAYNDEIESFLGRVKDKETELSKTDADEMVKAAEKEMEKAVDEYQKEALQISLDFFSKVKGIVQGLSQAIEGIQGAYNHYINGKIAMMKASMEAYVTEMDFFIKSIKDLISRLLESMTDIGEDIADIGRLIKSLYQINSQTMSSLSMAA